MNSIITLVLEKKYLPFITFASDVNKSTEGWPHSFSSNRVGPQSIKRAADVPWIRCRDVDISEGDVPRVLFGRLYEMPGTPHICSLSIEEPSRCRDDWFRESTFPLVLHSRDRVRPWRRVWDACWFPT
jgi:hypothetical protein